MLRYSKWDEVLSICSILWDELVDDESPFRNTGGGNKYTTKSFCIHAYVWGESDDTPNFKWRDFECSWYKYHGRGTKANKELSEEESKELIREFFEEFCKGEKNVY